MSGTPTLIKTPYAKTVFKTDKDLDDFIKCCDPQTGYLHFMDNFFYIQHPVQGSLVYHPYSYQKRLIETYHNYRYSISLMPRQSGKCFGINTIVKLRNIKTKKIEEITIGEFYERFSKMSNLSSRNERTSFPFVSQTQDDCYKLQTVISGTSHPLKKIARNKFKEFFRIKESWISTWGKTFTILGQIYLWKHRKNNKYQSRSQPKKERITLDTNRLLVKEDQWGYRKSDVVTHRTANNIFSRKMYSEIWRRSWIKTLARAAREVVKELQKTKLFSNISKTIQSHYGNLSINSSLLCYPVEGRYEGIYKQGVSVSSEFWKNNLTGFYRFGKEKNNRVRRDVLAWSTDIKSTTGKEARTGYIAKWLPIIKDTGRRLFTKSEQCIARMPELSDQVERKFIESYLIDDYEIFTDTGWEKITHLHLTIPYEVYEIQTISGLKLECADTHIVFDHTMNQIFVKDLANDSIIQTLNGAERIKFIKKTNKHENMFDITVGHENHRFYSNGILSHNSTSAAGYLLWYAMFVPDSTILVAAHKYTGAQEIMQRIRYAYEACPNHIKAGCTTYNKGSLDFENGSRIVSATTTENTGRGMSISLLYLDEFAFVRPTIAQEFWTSITPTLATGGKCIITSTPNSDEDQFALIWKGANKCLDEFGNTTDIGINGFKAYKAHWSEQPGRNQAWAEQIKAQLGEDKFRREINCEFIIADETLIAPAILIDLEGIEPIDRMGQVRWYKKPEKGNIYCIGLDPSLGTGSDPAAIQIFEANSTTQIGEWKHNKTSIPEQIKLLAQINKYIEEITKEPDNIYYSIENNTIGEAALISLHEYGENNIPGIFLSEQGKKRKGFNTTHKTKLAACAKLKTLVETKKMKLFSKSLISELKSFVASGGSYQAKIGDTDDLVMASLLTVRMLQALSDFHYNLEEQIRDHDEIIQPLPFFAVLN